MKKGMLIITLIVLLLICLLPSCSDKTALIDGSIEKSTKESKEIFNTSCTENTTSSTTIESESLYPDVYASVTEGKTKAEFSSYPYSAFGRYPLYATDPGIVDWLVLFGF